MDVSNLLAADGPQLQDDALDIRRQSHQYPTRHALTSQGPQIPAGNYGDTVHRVSRDHCHGAAGFAHTKASPIKKEAKHVVFQLVSTEDRRLHARLPMRVMIQPHDNTESIITTVKNFYGLYEQGVSFEDKDGINIIARFENFGNDMTIYVRTTRLQPEPQNNVVDSSKDSLSSKKPQLGAPFEMRPPQRNNAQSSTRSDGNNFGNRSLSPQSNPSRRSVSAVPGGKPRGRPSKSRENSTFGDAIADGYSSGDGGNGSATSSRRAENFASAEISLDNIVDGGRRKRAKFESCELPLFVPPQVPMTASVSSVSPQRRISGNNNAASPYSYSNQHTFAYTQPLPSPQSYGSSAHYLQSGMMGNVNNGGFQQPPARQLRARPNAPAYAPPRQSTGGILPTPDPTVGSVISDEDVALQLMRLGDVSNFSHGRTSTSTADDALSGKAEGPSSDEEVTDEEEEEASRLPAVPCFPKEDPGLPNKKRQRLMTEPHSDGTSGEEYDDHRDPSFKTDSDEIIPNAYGIVQRHAAESTKSIGPKPRHSVGSLTGSTKSAKPRATPSVLKLPKTKAASLSSRIPNSPSSLPTQSRKSSMASTINFQHALGADEEDLSSKPRCQRCRKSKKGCDRQRPCQRCKDAGIGAEGCLSEDEGNGRKGRYGRHMGVSIKKVDGEDEDDAAVMAPPAAMNHALSQGYFLAPAPLDKSKKRKR